METIPADVACITMPVGFVADATYCGLKRPGAGVLDVGLLASEVPCAAAGVFTTNKVVAAPVVLSRERLAKGLAQAIVFNSGNANACTGPEGLLHAQVMARTAAEVLGVDEELVLVASTGVIGVAMDINRLVEGIASLRPSKDGGRKVPRAMMTTDRTEKAVAVQWQDNGKSFTLAGVAKGAGMIHPSMATMLAFLTCDAPVDSAFLAFVLKEAVDDSFNMVTVDGDTSTNDTVFILSNGAAGGPTLGGAAPESSNEMFREALGIVTKHLARAIAQDGEGASKLVEVLVRGARTRHDARLAARAVAASNLVKAAVFGSDPNWGRILAAVGYSGAVFDPALTEVFIGDVRVAYKGAAVSFDRREASEAMKGRTVSIVIDLHNGEASATAWGCDLTPEYVLENSRYTT